jgi:hypothetical protein
MGMVLKKQLNFDICCIINRIVITNYYEDLYENYKKIILKDTKKSYVNVELIENFNYLKINFIDTKIRLNTFNQKSIDYQFNNDGLIEKKSINKRLKKLNVLHKLCIEELEEEYY